MLIFAMKIDFMSGVLNIGIPIIFKLLRSGKMELDDKD